MSVEYAKIETPEQIKECVSLQKKIFNLSDIDVIPEMFLRMIARKDPKMGLMVGAFKTTMEGKQLIGFHISLSANENNSLYSIATGVLPEYQNKMYGYGIMLKARELAIQDGIKTVFTLYDPLESNLARLYMQKFGFKGVRFKENAYELNNPNEIPNDKILLKLDILCEETIDKIAGTYKQVSTLEVLNKFPIVTRNKFIDNSAVIVEIPNDFELMKRNQVEKALEWRSTIRNIFSEYINKRNYVISNCFTSRIDNVRKIYYLLEKL